MKFSGHGREAVIEGETQRSVLRLDLLQTALHDDDVGIVTDEPGAHFHYLAGVIGTRTDGSPMNAGFLGGGGHAAPRVQEDGMLELIRHPGQNAQVAGAEHQQIHAGHPRDGLDFFNGPG